MSVREKDYRSEAEALLRQPEGSLPLLLMLDRLHRYGVWRRGNTNPRGSLTAPAKPLLDENLMGRVLFYVGEEMEPETCRKALLVIGQWGGKGCLAKPIRMLQSEKTDSDTRFYCLSAIRTIGGPGAVAAIAQVLKSGEPDLQEAAINAIIDLATGGSKSDIDLATDASSVAAPGTMEPKIAAELSAALSELSERTSAPFNMRYRAVDTLEYLRGKAALPPEDTIPGPNQDQNGDDIIAMLARAAAIWRVPNGVPEIGLEFAFGVGEEPAGAGSISPEAQFVHSDGHEQTVRVRVFPILDPKKSRLQTLGPCIYLSQDQTVVVSLEIPDEVFPEDVAELSVHAVTSDGREWPASETVTRGESQTPLEFAIPDAFRRLWSDAPRLILRETR
jgi:hypothetical protein